jgi:hypothetical protein
LFPCLSFFWSTQTRCAEAWCVAYCARAWVIQPQPVVFSFFSIIYIFFFSEFFWRERSGGDDNLYFYIQVFSLHPTLCFYFLFFHFNVYISIFFNKLMSKLLIECPLNIKIKFLLWNPLFIKWKELKFDYIKLIFTLF